MIFRASKELRSLDEIGPAALVPGDWRLDAQQSLAHVISGLMWSTEGDWCSASLPNSVAARFELSAQYSGGVTVLHVRGSRHADQFQLVQACAKAIAGYAFDMQTCQRVWPPDHGA